MKQVLKAVGLVLLLLTSCSKEESNPNNGNGNGNVTPPVEQKAIVITSYSKNYGYAGDSVDILGENFPKKEQCKVTFGDTEATIISVSVDGKKLTLVLPRSSTYLPELKFYFGEKTVVDNKVTNDYEQKIGIIDKAVGQWIKTQWEKISSEHHSNFMKTQIVGEYLYSTQIWGGAANLVIFSKDNGISWKRWEDTGPFNHESDFYVTPNNEGFNVYDFKIYKVPYGGTEDPFPLIRAGKYFFSKKGIKFNRVVCDDEMKNIIIVSIDGDVYKSTNGKDFYSVREVEKSDRRMDYQFLAFKRDVNHIWIGGLINKGMATPKILFCNGNNEQWTEYVFQNEPDGMAVAVDFPTNQIGYCLISGSVDKIYKSTDGGYSWQKLPFEFPIDIRSLAFQDENIGWVSLDKVIYKTTDGGNTWQKEFEAESNIKKLYYTQNVLYAFAENGLLYRYYFK
ncbi:IPT/TIG domain-containing protein [Capnocytophaga ochracea]|uniref:WD40/YVTN/BNR-like repeat-containing protein n=1 Tax=Capnocytophaga TaxID=1016 RepID=UPI00209E2DC8|nr:MULTISPECIES: IPT/TIG domain-containing protein [Capnocytophaga]MEB3015511.1 IPT/TIG domain-containing protein [Capnocytophaga ochracea]MEB3035884.1 IPT/TIG domain-containing protein [Capnocytophaga ochracea]